MLLIRLKWLIDLVQVVDQLPSGRDEMSFVWIQKGVFFVVSHPIEIEIDRTSKRYTDEAIWSS